jgi:hypothetical protein
MSYTFRTLNDAKDPTFNQLLAINDGGTIAGYFGSGATGHPNKGYVLHPNYAQANYVNENFPTSAQTQVTGINNGGVTVGFWVDGAGDNLGFIDVNGQFTTAVDPLAPALGGATPVTEQFLGVNDLNQAAGFYNDAKGNAHGFVYDAATGGFTAVTVTGATSVIATGINDRGQISGFFTKGGVTEGFIDVNGTITTLAGPAGATDVQALGLNDNGLVVGSYVDGSGNTDGFVYNTETATYTTVIDPNANGMTVVNGINDQGQLAGFYLDHAGNTDGMLATPPAPTLAWTFVEDLNNRDSTFNQNLAINNSGTIAGYYGSGAAGHPNKGYTQVAPYGQANYTYENFPTSAQTQVTGINNAGTTVGFWVDGAGDNLGFVDQNGHFTNVLDPAAPALGGTTPITEQLLGLNDLGKAAGFYNDAAGNSHGFIYDIGNGSFAPVNVAGATSVTATDINDRGQISGFFTAGGATEGFIDVGGKITTLAGPAGATDVQALGLNNGGLVVGSYVDGLGHTDGFVYNMATSSYLTVNDPHVNPNGGTTVINGINDLDQLVGFTISAAGRTHGFVASLTTPLGTGGLGSMATLTASTSHSAAQLMGLAHGA